MLLYRDGQFHISGVSFAIPDNYYLETCPGLEMENGMLLYSPDEVYSVELSAENSEHPSEVALKCTLESFDLISPIAPFQNNGLSGHIMLYKTKQYIHCEIKFDLDEDCEPNMFQVLFEFPAGFDVASFVNGEEFQRIMRCVKAA